jgi:hypothetical protein
MYHRFIQKANSSSVSQEIPHDLKHINVFYHFLKILSFVPNWSQINPVHAFASYFFKIHFNSIIPSMSIPSKWSLSFSFLHYNPVYTLPLPRTCHMPHPSHSSWFDHLNNISFLKMYIFQTATEDKTKYKNVFTVCIQYV